VMDYIDGVSLQAAVATPGSFSGGAAAAVGVEVAHGLQAAATAGLVHRDVKPANILIDRRGGVKILDLGIARLPGDDTHPQGEGAEVILGTIDYLAPEQAINSVAVDARADLYALGATLYFLIAGHPPFPSPNLRHKLAAKQYCDPPPVHRLRPDVDAGLAAVVQKLLKRDPADRYQTAAAVVATLAPFAALSSNYPARLFQPKRPSTIHDENAVHEPESPLPATQRIVRPDSLPTPTDLPVPHFDPSRDENPTTEVRKSPTDLAMTPIPAGQRPRVAEAAESQALATPAPRRTRLWLVGTLGLLTLLVAILFALM
jgi:eukaryotic-like serine/threonine-protein kinase